MTEDPNENFAPQSSARVWVGFCGGTNVKLKIFVRSLRSLFGVDEARVRTCTKRLPRRCTIDEVSTPSRASGTLASANWNRSMAPVIQLPWLSTVPHGAEAVADVVDRAHDPAVEASHVGAVVVGVGRRVGGAAGATSGSSNHEPEGGRAARATRTLHLEREQHVAHGPGRDVVRSRARWARAVELEVERRRAVVAPTLHPEEQVDLVVREVHLRDVVLRRADRAGARFQERVSFSLPPVRKMSWSPPSMPSTIRTPFQCPFWAATPPPTGQSVLARQSFTQSWTPAVTVLLNAVPVQPVALLG